MNHPEQCTISSASLTRVVLPIYSRPSSLYRRSRLNAKHVLIYGTQNDHILQGKGAFTGAERPVRYCVISRAEVSPLRVILQEVDTQAFMVIGQAHEALGEGFKPPKSVSSEWGNRENYVMEFKLL